VYRQPGARTTKSNLQTFPIFGQFQYKNNFLNFSFGGEKVVFSVVPKSIDPTEILVSYSGGKDSSCLLYLLQKRHVAFDRVIFADTGVEYPEVYEFIEQVEKRLGIDIERVHPKVTWDDWFYKNWSKGMPEDKIHGFPPRSGGCWARRELKTNPLKKAMGTGNTIFLGITADGS
jgi:3'-phosphoadenosine 5'-phosphosulfate sulfotransferase (PAPS reductase)/FAD synthetase